MKKRKLFKRIGILLLIVLCVSVPYLDARRPRGFHPKAIASPLTFSPDWAVNTPKKEEIDPIIQQDYFYLASGAQCFAFVSSDGKYVMKFFKMKHFLPKNWLKYVPLPLGSYRFRKTERRVARQVALFNSHKMAWDDLPEETGLVFVHLNKSKNLKASINLFDKEGQLYRINLDDYEFIIQKKSLLVREYIDQLMKTGDTEKAKKAISDLLHHIVHQCQKGYIDSDSGISNNYGFVGEKVIHFDVGQLVYSEEAKEPSTYLHEVLRVSAKLENWLSGSYPDLLPFLEESIDHILTYDSSSESSHSPQEY